MLRSGWMVPEERAAQKVNYEFEKWFETIRELQGDYLIFSTEGTSIRWIGNERGYAGDPLWQNVACVIYLLYVSF